MGMLFDGGNQEFLLERLGNLHGFRSHLGLGLTLDFESRKGISGKQVS